MFECRPDCAFVVSTHDHDLPLQIPAARVILLRSCNFTRGNVQNWDADELSVDSPIEDSIKRDLLGGRRKLLFVEGTEDSLDKSIYSLIFPMASVIPKGSCRDVERTVEGIRGVESIHWIRAFGIIDGDGLPTDEVHGRKERGVYVLPLYSVESIYYHPNIIEFIARRQANLTGGDGSTMAERAINVAVGAISGDVTRLTQKVAKRLVRKSIIEQLPSDDTLLNGKSIALENKAEVILANRKKQLDNAVANCDWESILKMCSIHETRALKRISESLRFPNRQAYEDAVRQLLRTDKGAVDSVRKLFVELFERLSE